MAMTNSQISIWKSWSFIRGRCISVFKVISECVSVACIRAQIQCPIWKKEEKRKDWRQTKDSRMMYLLYGETMVD